MKNPAWSKVIPHCPDPARARQMLDLFEGTPAAEVLEGANEERAALLALLFSGSRASTNLLIAHPDWIDALAPEALRHPRRKSGFMQEIASWLPRLLESADYSSVTRRLREFQQRELVRIALRDLSQAGEVPEIIREISDLADVCLDAIWQNCWLQLSRRYGVPYHRDPAGQWRPTAGGVLGLGKLGGQELNYSSDVDLMFVYEEEGGVFAQKPARTARPVLSNHQFFTRLAETFVAQAGGSRQGEGLYRIDLRLRPEGNGGPLARSLASYENYYAQWGQTWERMMLIKARGVAGDAALASEFLEMVQPFRYPRSIQEGVLREVAAMKDRIEQEVVKSGELERNVKLGRGGIREVEFIVQSLQVLHAGKQPFLQGGQTLPCLAKLAQYEWLSRAEADALADAYCFLRKVEHRLQMDENRQTHTLPEDRASLERLARLMQFENRRLFEQQRRRHTDHVRRIFERLLKAEAGHEGDRSPFPRQFEGAEAEWARLLTEHRFRDVPKAIRVLREFVEGPGYVHVSSRTRELALGLLPRFFARCPPPDDAPPAARKPKRSPSERPEERPSVDAPLSDPDRVLTRLDSFIAAYGARATLFELWHSNPAIFELLVLLFDRSEFLAELAIRQPDLVDELVASGRLRQRKTAAETLKDLRYGLEDEDQHLWLRRYHPAELMRIGLRDILGLADFEQYLTELSALADACLQYALEVVMRRHQLRQPPFVIIGLGKLGGAEIDYGSDLDIIFVADDRIKGLDRLGRLALEVMDLLSARTAQGMLFKTDARLRPDGEKGRLVNSLKAHEDYYRHRAGLWEIQSLTRTRTVAGDLKLGERFQQMVAQLTNFCQPAIPLAAYTADWRQKIHQMRRRIETERTPRGKDELAIKTGAGGLVDAEFVAQALCLENGWHEPNTLRALERGRAAGLLPHADQLIENYRRLRRIEGILRRWSYEGESVLPDDPAPYYRVSVRCGFPTPEAFRQALANYRAALRHAYNGFFLPKM